MQRHSEFKSTSRLCACRESFLALGMSYNRSVTKSACFTSYKLRSKLKWMLYRQHTHTHASVHTFYIQRTPSVSTCSQSLLSDIFLSHILSLPSSWRQTTFPVSLWWITHLQIALSTGSNTISTMTSHSDVSAGPWQFDRCHLPTLLKAA